jgi:4-amino-4-deoxy-L-arabinose transferase-like glycosyltransferase
MHRLEIILVAVLLAVYLVLGTLFALRTPLWQAPDEPAHYNYVRQLVEGALPVMAPGDWDQAYLSQVVGSRFDPVYNVFILTYEDWQPPLYYLLQVPAYRLSGGTLPAMRLVSVLLGAGVVLLAYLVARRVFRGRVWLGLAAAVFVAFLPQHLAILGSVNNDALAELLIAATLFVLVIPWPDEPPPGHALSLGLLIGAAFLTKGTAYLLAPVAGIFILARYWTRWRLMARALLLVFVPALLLGGLWWARNTLVYDSLDPLAREAHDAVVVGQPRTAEWLAEFGLTGTVGRFLTTTFNSFWGQFGWMAAPLPRWMYGLLLVLTLAAEAGLIVLLTERVRHRNREEADPAETAQTNLWILVLSSTLLLTVGLHIVYNLTFVQHQGRYLFPALIPIAVGYVAGLGFWFQPLITRQSWARWLLPLGLAIILLAISFYALWRILPGLAPG